MARLPARFSLEIIKGFNVEALIGAGIITQILEGPHPAPREKLAPDQQSCLP